MRDHRYGTGGGIDMEQIVVLDFGGQYKQLIARRIRELGVYCEIYPCTMPLGKLIDMNPRGIILTGGPASVFLPESPTCDAALFKAGIPILGICYGAQLMAHQLGGEVKTAPISEYGHAELIVKENDGDEGKDLPDDTGRSVLLKDVASRSTCWMSHTDYIASVPSGFAVTAHTPECPVAAMEDADRRLYAVQFHPEVVHSAEGTRILGNFVKSICGCRCDWEMTGFVSRTIEELRERIGSGKVLLGLSGGVDSSVAAALLSKAVGKQLTCVFVDHGLLRLNEGNEVEDIFGANGDYNLNFVRVNAAERFYIKLAGITDPEMKRRIIGAEFINVFEEEAKKIGAVDFLAQGTIYPDVVESGTGSGGAVIKSHHNVGGLPAHVDFKEIIEPLRSLFKDEVRKVGLELGLPRGLVYRQPFPGPGLGVRIVGDITADKVRIVQEADYIFREELDRAGIDTGEGQFFAALSDMRSVGVMGDGRTYDYAVVLRGVLTSDFMTAEAADIPWTVLQTCMNRIINEVRGVNRVLYDLTSKPPGTIELE